MPYFRRQARRAYRSKPVQNRVRVYGKAGMQLYKDVRYLKGLINSELHYDYASYTTTISTTASLYHLSAIPQNDTNTGRSGNTVLPRYLNMKWLIKNDNDNTNDIIRMMVFRWKDNSTPVVADILEDTSNAIYSPLNDNISGNLRDRQIDVIKEKYFLVGPESNSVQQLFKKVIDLNPPSKNVKDHIKFDDTSTTAPLGGIYVMFIGTQAISTANLSGMHKLSFHDN